MATTARKCVVTIASNAASRIIRAIEIGARYAGGYDSRARVRARKGDFDGALADYKKALELNPQLADALNNNAWLLATCAKDTFRNGAKAVEYATKACELTKWEEPHYMDTLAAAYAESGNFAEAVKRIPQTAVCGCLKVQPTEASPDFF